MDTFEHYSDERLLTIAREALAEMLDLAFPGEHGDTREERYVAVTVTRNYVEIADMLDDWEARLGVDVTDARALHIAIDTYSAHTVSTYDEARAALLSYLRAWRKERASYWSPRS